MKKFRPGDIFLNRVKAYPKVEFFVNSGSVDSVYYNRTIQSSGSAVSDGYLALNNFPNPPEAPPASPAPPETFYVLAEDSDAIVTEAGDQITIETT